MQRLQKIGLGMTVVGFALGVQLGIQQFKIVFPPLPLYAGFVVLSGIGIAILVAIDHKRFPRNMEE